MTMPALNRNKISMDYLRNFILWSAVLISAIAVVYANHLCREKYSELSYLEKDGMNLDINYGRLLLEYSAWGSMHRVEKIARENQKMVIPQSPDIIAVDQNRLEIN